MMKNDNNVIIYHLIEYFGCLVDHYESDLFNEDVIEIMQKLASKSTIERNKILDAIKSECKKGTLDLGNHGDLLKIKEGI